MTPLFLDSEFTGLHQHTTLISLGIVDVDNNTFYAEFNDYDNNQCDDWIIENVIGNLLYSSDYYSVDNNNISMCGNSGEIVNSLTKWLMRYTQVEIWSDCYAYDWVLFNNLYGHAFNIPDIVYYIPFDISTAFRLSGIDPDISRESYAGMNNIKTKHNALHDAIVIKKCYDRLQILV